MPILLTANELKTKGVSRLEKVAAAGEEAIISVRGKNRLVFVLME